MRYLRFVLRFGAVIAIFMWIKNGGSNIEPFVAALTLCLSFLPTEINSSKLDSNKIESLPAPPPLREQREESQPKRRTQGFPYASPTAFFELRFASAFPGQRESKWFYGTDAVNRLSILLQNPLVFYKPDSRVEPIWWFRDGNSSITQFAKVSDREVLLDHKELVVEKIYAAYSKDYKRLFVYVKCSPSPSTGLYKTLPAEEAPYLEQFGYLWEEYGLFKDHMVTRAEHDDNAAVIMGKPVSLEGKSEIRTRYTTPYNFVVCAQDSPMNDLDFDRALEKFMNSALTDDEVLPTFTGAVKELPHRRYG